MRVIQYGPKEEEIICNHCGSLLAYTEKDEYWECDEYYVEEYILTLISGAPYVKKELF